MIARTLVAVALAFTMLPAAHATGLATCDSGLRANWQP